MGVEAIIHKSMASLWGVGTYATVIILCLTLSCSVRTDYGLHGNDKYLRLALRAAPYLLFEWREGRVDVGGDPEATVKL